MRFLSLPVVSLGLLIAMLFAICAQGQGVGPHVSGGHLAGSAAGLDDGYTEANAFVPLWQPNRDSLLFADGSFLLFNDGSDFRGGNLGGGVRSWQDFSNSIVGVYGYYDRRELDVTSFDQFGLGIESLGYIWDARLNVNVPVGEATYSQTTAPGFIGTGFGTRTTSIHGLTVLDAEVGAVLWANEKWQFRSFLGAYGLFDNVVQDTPGARGRIEARLNDQCWIGGFIEHDREFDTTGGATFTWRFGRGKKPCNNSGYNVMARLGDPVQRRKYVALGKSETTTLATIQGQSLRIAHFVPGGDGLTGQTVTPSGDGSVEKPYNSLAFVETSTADVIYIHPGVYEGASIRVTKDGQQVVAATGLYAYAADDEVINFQGTASGATLNEAPMDAITIAANDVTVSGFTITSAGRHGIFASNQQGLRLLNNTMSNNAQNGIDLASITNGSLQYNSSVTNGDNGIRLQNFSGELMQNEFSRNAHNGLQIDGDYTGSLAGSRAIQNGGSGILAGGNIQGLVWANSQDSNGLHGMHIQGNIVGLLTGNSAHENNGDGILIGGNVTIGTDDHWSQGATANHASGNQGTGIKILGGVTGSLSGNTAYGNQLDGIYVDGNVSREVRANIAAENHQTGIYLNGSVGGTPGVQFGGEIHDNTASENGGDGIHVVGDVSLGLFNNALHNNVDDGAEVDGTVHSYVAGNFVSRNGGNGIEVHGDVLGQLTTTYANGNGGHGAIVHGDVRYVLQNSVNSNTGDGVVVLGDVLNDVSGNVFGFWGAQQRGLRVQGNVLGDLSYNQAHGNNVGIEVYGNIYGDINNQELIGNATDGIRVHGNVTGDVINNTTNNNGDDGIDIDGVVSGATSPNFAAGNGDQAFEN